MWGGLRQRGRRLRARRRLSDTARRVQDEKLTYLRPERLRLLEWCAGTVREHGVQGDFVECGVALGGSTVVLARAMGPGRRLHGYDVFGMIPPPGDEDPPEVHERYATIAAGSSAGIGGDEYYGYRDDLREHVERTLARYGTPVGEDVQLHQGLFDETLHPTAPIALAHIDSDWYDPVRVCLERIAPWLARGGFMVLDDYLDYGGCRKAADRFMERSGGRFSLRRFSTNAAIVREA